MISKKEATRISKFLSLILRHQPQVIGIRLDENGWADVPTLIQQLNNAGEHIDFTLLEHIVATNLKRRFSFNEDRTKIRVNQGHSIEVDLDYEPKEPPAVLYHGTSEKTVPAIMEKGLEKRNRHHVHLSRDIETAIQVGQRHGKPVVLAVKAKQMHEDGFVFFLSENGVWLTDYVPNNYIDSFK